jgi:hypothetical protein
MYITPSSLSAVNCPLRPDNNLKLGRQLIRQHDSQVERLASVRPVSPNSFRHIPPSIGCAGVVSSWNAPRFASPENHPLCSLPRIPCDTVAEIMGTLLTSFLPGS